MLKEHPGKTEFMKYKLISITLVIKLCKLNRFVFRLDVLKPQVIFSMNLNIFY